ncbi:SCO family protein [Puniceibacterium sediminis]|uniref:Protein SCO1/2 n=1 Tax=Puniceibacterium sediminis TaxID=1608407 RepID=A0A238VQM9_9RHOB|nr:SCO family protein [Puniceibacterium sediminis]SNR36536.1 protein SCO1/2 [Puniceibacterium sediminis]
MSRIAALAAGTAIAALVAGIWYVTMPRTGDDIFADCRSSQIAGGSDTIGGDFTLVDTTGKTVSSKDVITKPSLVYFGYTFCPDICPIDNARNAEAVDILEENGEEVTPVFITIDPQRDTPEVMAYYVANMHDRMVGLTGSPEQIKAASQAYRTYYKAQEADDEYYLVDHSTFTYLVLPEYGFVEYFRNDLSADQVAERVGCFVEKL